MEATRQIAVRIPIDIYEKLRKIARKERRSFGKQVVLYVERQMKAEGHLPEQEIDYDRI